MVLIDGKTHLLKKKMRMNAASRGVVFFEDSNGKTTLISADREGHIYEWDLRSGRCLTRFRNTRCVEISSIAVNRTGFGQPRLAVGTNSGSVDIFGVNENVKERFSFLKSLDHIQTTVTSIKFHPSGEALAFASKWDRDKLKLAHTESETVFANFPTARQPLRYVSCIEFSNEGGWMAVGNDKGRVLLYRMGHYA